MVHKCETHEADAALSLSTGTMKLFLKIYIFIIHV